MGEHLVFSVGRDLNADIQLQDESVSRVHAELVSGSDGLICVSDCSSSGGTYVRECGEWRAVNQCLVESDSLLMFGHYQIKARTLLSLAPKFSSDLLVNELPTGRVRRDPVSGDIISE